MRSALSAARPPRTAVLPRRPFWALLALCGLPLLGIAAAAVEAHMTATTNGATYTEAGAVPRRPVAIVFGAQVLPGGSPSRALANRLDDAVALYRAGRVERLLLTGDGSSSEYYDEPAVMRAYALERGVPDAAIVQDTAGLRTYDSCYRAKAAFGVESAVLVTQAYHLPRAIYTCERLGVRAVGFAAEPLGGRAAGAALRREHPARWLAWWQVTVTRPAPRIPGPRAAALDDRP